MDGENLHQRGIALQPQTGLIGPALLLQGLLIPTQQTGDARVFQAGLVQQLA